MVVARLTKRRDERRGKVSILFGALLVAAALFVAQIGSSRSSDETLRSFSTASGVAFASDRQLKLAEPLTPPGIESVNCSKLMEEMRSNATDTTQQRLNLRYTRDEPRFWISLHSQEYDPVRWATMIYGRYYEQVLTEAFKTVIIEAKRRDPSRIPRVVDVGGNIGWFSLVSASMGARVDTFEPNRLNDLRVCESACLNRWNERGCGQLGGSGTAAGRVRLFPVGIGAESSTAAFDTGTTTSNNPGGGRVVGTSAVTNRGSRTYFKTVVGDAHLQKIQLEPLDGLAETQGWLRDGVDILKIDTEGFEENVIKGARVLLKSQKVANIFMEGNVDYPQHNAFRSIVGTLLDSGYGLYKIGGFSGPRKLFEVNLAAKQANTTKSILFHCMGGTGRLRKQCNLWWRLREEAAANA